jgi:hypothetical protein
MNSLHLALDVSEKKDRVSGLGVGGVSIELAVNFKSRLS